MKIQKNIASQKFYNTLIKILSLIIVLCWAFLCCAFFYNRFNRYVYPLKFQNEIIKYSNEYDVSPYLILATIKVESNFRVDAQSEKGAKGLMQIKDNTAKYIAQKIGDKNYDLFNEQDNIKYGTYYLRYLMDKFDNLENAVCAYNAGEGIVFEWLNNKEYSNDGKILKKIPYNETEKYLEKILRSLKKYEKLYEKLLDK